MTMAPVLSSVILGALAGIAELLPVSGDGHLALARILFGLRAEGVVPGALLHAGILVAIAAAMRQPLKAVVAAAAKGLLRPVYFRSGAGRDGLFLAIACLPAGLSCFALRSVCAQRMESPSAVGLGLCATTVLVGSTYWARPGENGELRLSAALLVGTAQGLSMLPGVSLSGLLLTSFAWFGVRRERSFELAMLMMLPTLLLRCLFELPELWRAPGSIGTGLAGSVVALLAALAGLAALRRLVGRGVLALFALWTLPLGLATLAMSLAWPV